MREKDYVTIEVAKMLQEKGFREPCYAVYTMEFKDKFKLWVSSYRKTEFKDLSRVIPTNLQLEYLAPSLMMAEEWVWEKYKIVISAFLVEPFVNPYRFSYAIQSPLNGIDNYGSKVCTQDYDSFYAAYNAGLLSALESIKVENNEVKHVTSENHYG